MWLAVTVLLGALLLATCDARAQCAGGVCRVPRRQPAPQYDSRPSAPADARQPTPAWRYEHAVGHRRAVVRIVTTDGVFRGGQTRSLGSGVLIRWGRRLLVVTAAHVVRDAKQVFVWLVTGRRYQARVLTVDRDWDCAVLDIGQPADLDVEPAEVETGQAAHPKPDERLETCGYGGDGKLACNFGLFRRYYTRASRRGPADWMAISGYNRNGDSGGPVFNGRGRLIGIMWGSTGGEIMAVQPGRLHLVLNRAVGASQVVVQNNPAPPPPMPELKVPQPKVAKPPDETGILPLCRRHQPAPAPAPSVVVDRDPLVGRILVSIDRKLDVVV